MTNLSDASCRRCVRRGAIALGVALGGFFDGILLHQILQWHHLLSGVTVGPLGDLRWQVLADGLFHALMYVIGAVGLVWLYRARTALGAPGASARLGQGLLFGFGGWHVTDAVVSHWVTGLHRVRMDVEHPLVWDLAWFAVFGLLPILLALRWGRRPPGPRRGTAATPAVLAAVLVAGGAWLNLVPVRADAGIVTVILRPDRTFADLAPALARSDARLLWSDPTGGVWVLRPMAPARQADWYRHGALYVSGVGGMATCADWVVAR